ncbi:MAG: GNAT family N-acetyltransferase [Rhodoferax sp.]|nr:GNAT family N-acetyltransferase [Rhodoferax sp.]MBP9929873.1 GNAT family N-acetyltransferase [Rhodoferax sp.]HQX61051.1 GNAT family N-acyltransferase [Burkholderiaceae bacterium]HQZ04240.1 GNAT family N-acyltransferase [Burkholderiaceae bacterium]
MNSTSTRRSLLARLGRQGPSYSLRLAQTPEDVKGAQALRFLVFNVELNEGLSKSFSSCLDIDEFDAVCDHLLVEDVRTGTIVGTYRLQTGACAQAHLGYYSAREFEFAPFDHMRDSMLELGRACIHHDHRSFAVLSLLWRGIAEYSRQHATRYLIGCSSLTSQDCGVGAATWQRLSGHLAPAQWRTVPLPAFACALDTPVAHAPKTPKLLATYLSLGAMMCGPPAIDRDFGTIDFLTLVDLQAPNQPRRLARFGIQV